MKKIVLIALLSVFALNAAFSQKTKFGHVDSNAIFAELPERGDAVKIVEEFIKTLESQLLVLNEERQKKYDAYVAERETYSNSIKQMKEEEIMTLEQRIQSFQQRAQQDAQAKEVEVLEPIYSKIREAIKVVGEEKGLMYVFDVSSLLYFSPESVDVTADVRTKLGIK
jgi:outer membrane protein